MFRKSESKSFIRDEYVDLNESAQVDEGFLHPFIKAGFRKSRVCVLTALAVSTCIILLGWSATAVSKSTSAMHPSIRDHFKHNMQMQASDWGKSAMASLDPSAQLRSGQGKHHPLPYGNSIRPLSPRLRLCRFFRYRQTSCSQETGRPQILFILAPAQRTMPSGLNPVIVVC